VQGQADRVAVAVLGGVGYQFGPEQFRVVGELVQVPGGEDLADRGASLAG
jgi:hypothetical protein